MQWICTKESDSSEIHSNFMLFFPLNVSLIWELVNLVVSINIFHWIENWVSSLRL